jgi:hypothetical protein
LMGVVPVSSIHLSLGNGNIGEEIPWDWNELSSKLKEEPWSRYDPLTNSDVAIKETKLKLHISWKIYL